MHPFQSIDLQTHRYREPHNHQLIAETRQQADKHNYRHEAAQKAEDVQIRMQ